MEIKETGYENISKTTKTRSEVEQEVTERHGNDSINPADEGQVAALKAGEGKEYTIGIHLGDKSKGLISIPRLSAPQPARRPERLLKCVWKLGKNR